MPPNRSRRLPGGRIRRPAGGDGAAQARGAARPVSPAQPPQRDPEESPAAEISDTVMTLEDFRVERPAAAEPLVSTPRRSRRGRGTAVRTGPTSMDLAARGYDHIRGDLIRIAVIALIGFGIIVALSFVLK